MELRRSSWLKAQLVIFAGLLTMLAIGFSRWHQLVAPPPLRPLEATASQDLPAHDFSLSALAGGTVRLSDFRGQVILLNFWATWCPPCQAEMPSLEKLHRRYAARGFTVLAVSVDDGGSADVERFAAARGLSFPILLEGKAATSRQYGVRGLPTTFLIDRRGHIVSTTFGAQDWSTRQVRQTIEQLLNQT